MPQTVSAQVFISYSHKDSQFFDELQTHLRPYERAGIFTVWSDKKIAPGSQWYDEIKAAMTSAKVAVMMVSPSFLESNFIHEHELEPLLMEAKQGGVCILWIPVRACSYLETPIKDYQSVLPPNKPLASMKVERDEAWVAVCLRIKEAVERTTGTQSAPIPVPDTTVTSKPTPAIHTIPTQGPLVGLPGQTHIDQVIIAAGGSPLSPMGNLLYKK